MRSSHDFTEGRIFKYEDFSEEFPEMGKGVGAVSAETPYIIFTDEDLAVKKEPPASAKAPPEGNGASAELEKGLAKDGKLFEDPSISFAERIIEKAEKEAEDIVEASRSRAEEIVAEAEEAALELRSLAKEEGYKEGHSKGLFEGGERGREQALKILRGKYREIFENLETARESIDRQKDEVLRKNVEGLTELAIAVSEKIVCVSLESSGEVIKRMILQTAAPAGGKQWAKVMISAQDAAMMEEDGIEIKKELYEISDKIDLIAVDDADPGICLIEFPDYVIDAGAATQMQNIKDIIRGADKE